MFVSLLLTKYHIHYTIFYVNYVLTAINRSHKYYTQIKQKHHHNCFLENIKDIIFMNNKNEGKNITLSEQFLILIQKSWKEREIGMSTTFIHDS